MAKFAYKRSLLTQKALKSLLHYNPRTGIFVWRVSRHNTIRPGDRAGTRYERSWVISIGPRKCHIDYQASCLAWLYMTGRWPKQEIDHKNRNPFDNRFSNLREASTTNNLHNRIMIKRKNKTGAQSIFFNRQGRYRVRIIYDGKSQSFGSYTSLHEAIKVRNQAAKQLLGEFSPFTSHP